MPEFLYKYRPLNSHTLRTISSSEIYFASPNDFNDPFDCNIVPNPIYTSEEAEKFIREMKQIDVENHFERAYETFRTTGMQTFYHSMVRDIAKMRDSVRICSLSEIPNSVMMFSHYAAGHRGVCLELRLREESFFENLAPVIYPKDFPIFHPFRDDRYKQLLDAEFLTKSEEWAYEKEWRIIKPEPEPAIYKIPEGALTAIIFACQTSEKDRVLVRGINESRKRPAELREAYKLEKSFSLGIQTIQ